MSDKGEMLLDRKICLITGSNSGIGKAAAAQISNKGYHVILGCRNKSRGEAALKEIKEHNKDSSLEVMVVDMSLQSSIKSLVKEFNDKYNTLDVLIHNAAEFDISRKKAVFTEEGIESIWAANHLGPVLLTELLLDPLKQSPQGRIITIASKGLALYPKLKVNLEDPELRSHRFTPAKAYYQSKLAQVMYTYWLVDKLSDSLVTVNCIRVTNVKIDISRYPNISEAAKFMYSIKSRFSISPEQMAEAYTYLADSEEVEKVTGKYFNENNRIVKSSEYSYNSDSINKVMDLTLRYLDFA